MGRDNSDGTVNSRAHNKSYLIEVITTLCLISTFDFGSAYIYDLPQSLAIAFENELGLTDSQSLLFYSAYAFPNLIVNLVGGYLLNKIGYKICLVAYASIICLGQAIFILGAQSRSYPWMLTGRAFIGLGAENLMIAQYFTSHKFFEHSFLSLAIGIDMSMGLLASLVSFYVSPFAYIHSGSLQLTLWISFIGPAVSLLSVIIFVWKYSSEDKVNATIQLLNEHASSGRPSSAGQDSMDNPLVEQKEEIVAYLPGGHVGMAVDGLTDNRRNTDNIEKEEKKPFKVRDLLEYPREYWILMWINVWDMLAYYQFIGVATKLVSVKFSLSYDDAKDIPLAIPLALIFLIPSLTKVIHLKGNKPLYLIVGPLIGTCTYFGLTGVSGSALAYPSMLLIALFGACMYSTFWSSVAIVSESVHVDMGMAVQNTVQNVASFITPIVLGRAFPEITAENADRYLCTLGGFVFLGTVGGIALYCSDRSSGRRLSMPEQSRG